MGASATAHKSTHQNNPPPLLPPHTRKRTHTHTNTPESLRQKGGWEHLPHHTISHKKKSTLFTHPPTHAYAHMKTPESLQQKSEWKHLPRHTAHIFKNKDNHLSSQRTHAHTHTHTETHLNFGSRKVNGSLSSCFFAQSKQPRIVRPAYSL